MALRPGYDMAASCHFYLCQRHLAARDQNRCTNRFHARQQVVQRTTQEFQPLELTTSIGTVLMARGLRSQSA